MGLLSTSMLYLLFNLSLNPFNRSLLVQIFSFMHIFGAIRVSPPIPLFTSFHLHDGTSSEQQINPYINTNLYDNNRVTLLVENTKESRSSLIQYTVQTLTILSLISDILVKPKIGRSNGPKMKCCAYRFSILHHKFQPWTPVKSILFSVRKGSWVKCRQLPWKITDFFMSVFWNTLLSIK